MQVRPTVLDATLRFHPVMLQTTYRRAISKVVRKSLDGFPPAGVAGRWYIRYTLARLVHPWINELINCYLHDCPRDFVTTTAWGGSFRGNTVDLLQRYLYLYGVWEPNLTAWLSTRLHNTDVFVDVGANIGYYSVLAASRVRPDGHVVAIEPLPYSFAMLKQHIHDNTLRNVRLVNEAASDTRHNVEMFQAPPDNVGESSTINALGFEPVGEVTARPLSEALTTDEIRRTRIIKIDVEGAELAVMQGLLPALSAVRNDCELVIEVRGATSTSTSARESCNEISNLLKPFGFHPYAIPNFYEASAYRSRSTTARPSRLRRMVEQETDLIFSRVDADEL